MQPFEMPALLVLAAALASGPALADGPQASAAHAQASRLTGVSLSAAPAPAFSRYRVMVRHRAGSAQPAVRQVWTFQREADQVMLSKGSIDELWHRDAGGQVRFERIFHDDRRVVDYSAGELAALNVATDWVSLSSLLGAPTLTALRVVSRRGSGAGERVVLAGRVGEDTFRVDWRPALQLPERMHRTERSGRTTELVLEHHAAIAPAGWQAPGTRSAEYLRIDAADLGDMQYEAVARKSEALDVRLGWRGVHRHD